MLTFFIPDHQHHYVSSSNHLLSCMTQSEEWACYYGMVDVDGNYHNGSWMRMLDRIIRDETKRLMDLQNERH